MRLSGLETNAKCIYVPVSVRERDWYRVSKEHDMKCRVSTNLSSLERNAEVYLREYESI
jgi:hypothetical protein